MADLRPVFYVSDGTGITAETIGHSLLTQFPGLRFVTDRLPFVDTLEKARLTADKIRQAGEAHGMRPVVVNSCVDPALNAVLAGSGARDAGRVRAVRSIRWNASSGGSESPTSAVPTAWWISTATTAASTR